MVIAIHKCGLAAWHTYGRHAVVAQACCLVLPSGAASLLRGIAPQSDVRFAIVTPNISGESYSAARSSIGTWSGLQLTPSFGEWRCLEVAALCRVQKQIEHHSEKKAKTGAVETFGQNLQRRVILFECVLHPKAD